MVTPAKQTELQRQCDKTKCKHGNVGYCGFCEAEKAPKCKEHQNPHYCGFCGKVQSG